MSTTPLPDQPEQVQEEHKERQRKQVGPRIIAAYVLSFLVATLTFLGSWEAFGPLPALLSLAIVLIIMVSILPNMDQGLGMVSDHATSVAEELVGVVSRIEASAIKRGFAMLFRLWHAVLFKPFQFDWMRYKLGEEPNIGKRLAPLAATTLLFITAAVLIPLLLTGHLPTFEYYLVVVGVPTAIMSFVLRPVRLRRFGPSRASSITWACLLVQALLLSYVIWESRGHDAQMLGARILVGMFLAGLGIGWLLAIESHPKSEAGPVKEVVLLAAILGFFLSFAYAAVPQPKELEPIAQTDTLLAPFYGALTNLGLTTVYGEPPLPSLSDPPTSSTTLPTLPSSLQSPDQTAQSEANPFQSLALAVGLLGLLGCIIGAALGRLGILLWLVEAPIFYIGWLLLTLGQQQEGLRLVKAVSSFDDWRFLPWPWERQFYMRVAHEVPEELPPLLVPQIFFSARHSSATRSLVAAVEAFPAPKWIETMISLLPFSNYDWLRPWLQPTIGSLWEASQVSIYPKLFERSKGVFHYIEHGASGQLRSRHRVTLAAFDRALNGRWDEVTRASQDAAAIVAGFADYSELASVQLLYRMAVATKSSLAQQSLRDIRLTLPYWEALKQLPADVAGSVRLPSYVDELRKLAELADKQEEQNTLAQAALSSIVLQEYASRDKSMAEQEVGIRECRLVSEHFTSLLRRALREQINPET